MTDTRESLARQLEDLGRRWHLVNKHPGPYGECPEKTCYHTHRMVIQ